MPGRIRSGSQYALAVLVPILIGASWPWARTISPFPASVFFLCIAVIARFSGFRPALLCTLTSAGTLWAIVSGSTPYTPSSQIIRVLTFVVAALVVASVSRQRSREVREAEQRYRRLFDTALDAILFVDTNDRFIDANPAATALLGYSRQELAQRQIGDLSRPEDRGKAPDVFRCHIAEGVASGETVIVQKNGETREVEYRCIGNAMPGVHVVVMQDITARKNAERSLHAVSGRLLHLQDEERRRIARQLHETTAQSLAAIRLNLSRISRAPGGATGTIREAVEESIDLTDQSIIEIRTLSYLLHPPMIDESGLLPSLQWFARGFEQRSGVTTILDAPEEIGRLPQEVETAVFRIVQEALTNIQRHSGSAIATIRLKHTADHLCLEVADEGHGMRQELRDHPDALLAAGVGIAGIRQRVEELEGTTKIESDDRGTRIVVELPLQKTLP